MHHRDNAAARRGATGRTVLALAAVCAGLLGPASAAMARDINLGGHKLEQRGHRSPSELKAQLPEGMVALPRVVASVQEHNTGRWKRVLVDAYLAPVDGRTTDQMRGLTRDIADRIKPQLESQSAESLQAAYQGPMAARDAIRQATEQSLGHAWKGDILIRSLAVF